MIKSILASLTGYGSDRTVLDTSIALARLFDARVDCLHVQLDPASAEMMVRSGVPLEYERVERARLAHARQEFEAVCKRNGLPSDSSSPSGAAGVSLNWRFVEGFDSIETPRRGQFHDLAVIARDQELPPWRLGQIVMNTGRPIVIAPAKPVETIGRKVAIGWKSGPESARMLATAMPLLVKAQKVLVYFVAEGESDDGKGGDMNELIAHLNAHGVDAEPARLSVGASTVAETIRQAAYNAGADLLAIGAYGRSRLRELVFGGVTREMLHDCALPVLMFH